MKKLTFLNETMISTTFISCSLLFASCEFDQQGEENSVVFEKPMEAKFDYNMPEKDVRFVFNAAEINLQQIQLAQLAQKNGGTTAIRELGKSIEDAHTESLNGLTLLAESKTISLPTSTDQNSKNDYHTLNGKSGDDFDKAYADMMVSGLQDAIAIFEEASTESQDTEIKNWVTSVLPELRASLDKSIDCQKKCDKQTLNNK